MSWAMPENVRKGLLQHRRKSRAVTTELSRAIAASAAPRSAAATVTTPAARTKTRWREFYPTSSNAFREGKEPAENWEDGAGGSSRPKISRQVACMPAVQGTPANSWVVGSWLMVSHCGRSSVRISLPASALPSIQNKPTRPYSKNKTQKPCAQIDAPHDDLSDQMTRCPQPDR